MALINEIIFSDDDYIISHARGEIQTSDDFSLRGRYPRPKIGGLYDLFVFGMTGHCKCGLTTMGKCPQCGYTVLDEKEYLKGYAYYQLHYPFSVSFKLENLISRLDKIGIKLPKLSNDMLINIWSLSFDIIDPAVEKLENSLFEKNGEQKELDENEEDKKRTELYYPITIDGSPYTLKISPIEPDTDFQTVGILGLQSLLNAYYNGESLSWMKENINSVLLISSPGLRKPTFPVINGKIHKHFPDIHVRYKFIIAMDKYVDQLIKNVKYSTVDKATLLYSMNKLYDLHINKSSMFNQSKSSLIRSSISSTVGSSMRWNAISYSKAKLNEIYLPKSACYHALQSQIIQQLVNTDENTDDYDAFLLYEKQDPRALAVFNDLISHAKVLLSRNPTLHRNNMVQFIPILWSGDMEDTPAIGVNPYINKSFNLDYDGDQLAVYIFTDEKQKVLLGDSLRADNIWIYDKTHAPIYLPSSTTMYGLYSATKIVKSKNPKEFDKFETIEDAYKKNEIEFDEQILLLPNKLTTYGREKVSKILGVKIEDIIGLNPLTLNEMSKILAGLVDHPRRMEIIQEIRDFGNEIATIVGIDTLPVKDLYSGMSKEIDDVVNDSRLNDIQKLHKITNMIPKALNEAMKKLPDSNIDVLMEGSRINANTLKSLYTPYVRLDSEGKIKVGDSSLVGGLSEEEYIHSAHTQREILEIKQGAIPRGGFNRSQLVIVSSKYIYKKGSNPEESYIFLPKSLAKGRKIIEGVEGNEKDLVAVKSTATNNSTTIYEDELDPLSNRITTNKARIGIAYADAITEFMTQAQLALKYGGLLNEFNGDDIKAVNSGEPTYDNEHVRVGNEEYILGYNIIPSDKVVKGEHIKVGDIIAINSNLVRVEYRLAKFITLFDLQVATDKDPSKFYLAKGIDYAPKSGNIRYVNGHVYIDAMDLGEIKKGITYFYPNNYHVKYGDRISSCIMDLKAYIELIPKEYVPYLFYLELNRISKLDEGVNLDLAEVMFKVLVNANYSVKEKLISEKDFGTRQRYGATRKGFVKAIKDSSDKNGTVSISLEDNNPFLKLMVRSAADIGNDVDWELDKSED